MSGIIKVRRKGDPRPILESCRLAKDVVARMRGLLGRDQLSRGEGLWIKPCNSVHTCFMKFPIDVIYLDSAGSVLRIDSDMSPWRFSRIVFGAKSVLEIAAGTALEAGIRPGDQLIFEAEGNGNASGAIG